jgi:hypothetical protein
MTTRTRSRPERASVRRSRFGRRSATRTRPADALNRRTARVRRLDFSETRPEHAAAQPSVTLTRPSRATREVRRSDGARARTTSGSVGASAVGWTNGSGHGTAEDPDFGCANGSDVGSADDPDVGEPVGVDSAVGEAGGEAVGDEVGSAVGEAVGSAVGEAVGSGVGEAVGEAVGDGVGSGSGSGVGSTT